MDDANLVTRLDHLLDDHVEVHVLPMPAWQDPDRFGDGLRRQYQR
jgi:hypothetical protein